MQKLRAITLLTAIASFCVSGLFAQTTGDPDAGAKVYKKCKACHQIGEDAKNRVGPHLNGVLGREAGSLEGYKYSISMTEAGEGGLIWTDDVLDTFLKRPKSLLPKTRMNFKGLKKKKDRENVVAYLRLVTEAPRTVSETESTARPEGLNLEPSVFEIVGDVEYGEYLSSDCKTCHQDSGDDDGIPAILGWPTEDFVVAMHTYKQKLRPHPVMQMMAGRLSNEEIAALAAYFNALE